MKILAIRGQNLTSLPKVALELEAAPLADTRLFAITGPTGAGKSTLLDALCLALYDRVPRLLSAREAAEGDLELPASDPRSVVRRGAVAAMAQVDFRDKEGKVLRATWEAWRARRKPTGRLQPQRMSLHALEGEVDLTGATKTETLNLIRERVGLSFDEFRRAVLLAQGDFAAFLAAKPDERAALLERMTGTDLYARLSVRAFERAKEEDQALRQLEDRQQGLSLLAPEARAELDALLEVSRTRQATLHTRAEQARTQVTWYQTQQRLTHEVGHAKAARTAAQEAWIAAEPRRRDLATAKEAELLRPAQRALRTAEEARAKSEARLAAALRTRDERQAGLGAVESAHEAAQAEAQAVRAETEARAPEVAAARAIDGALTEARDAEAKAKALASERMRGVLEAREASDAARTESEALAQERRSLEAWLESQTTTRALAAQWPRWSEALDRYRTADARSVDAAEIEADSKEVLHKASRREQEARARLEEVARRITAAQTERRALAAKLAAASDGQDPNALARATALLAEHRTNVESMRGLALEARRAHQSSREAAEGEEAAAEAEAEAARAIERLRETQTELQSRLDEARAAQALEHARRDLAARRHELLSPGQACPLCGSTEHPEADRAPPSQPPRADRLEALEAELEAGAEALRTATRVRDQQALRRAAMQDEATRAQARLHQIRGTWSEHLARLEEAWLESPLLAKHGVQKVALLLPRAPKLTGSTTEVSEALARLETMRAALLEQTEAQSRLRSTLEACRDTEEALQSRRGATQAEVDAASAARIKSERTLADAEAAVERTREEMAQALQTLEQPFARRPDWPEALTRDPASFVDAVRGQVAAFEARSEAFDGLEPRVAEAAQRATIAAEKLELAERAAREAKTEHAGRVTRRDELAEARAEQLGGTPVEAWEQSRKAARERTEANEARARESLRAAREALAVAQSELQTASTSAEEAARVRAEEAAGLEAALDRASVPDRDTLERMLDRGPGWLEALEAELSALDEARVRAETTLSDRAARLEAHTETGAPDVSPAEAEQTLERTREDLEALVDTLAELRARVSADDEAKARLADLLPKIQGQRGRLELYSELSALIGSADGKKLRTFAQGLTLDVLVEQSNLHLKALRPRYTLHRMRGQAMELAVVDHDLGDELRYISTLSGGERFLVSLALALGLSTLSSRNVRIESLFIDEGFGALDRDTLEIALSTLDQLQAEGRTVGIISHVTDLADRIGYRVEVRPTGPGTSEVQVVGA